MLHWVGKDRQRDNIIIIKLNNDYIVTILKAPPGVKPQHHKHPLILSLPFVRRKIPSQKP